MILEYCEGGDLQGLIMDMHKIENKNEVIKRIIAKIVLTLEVMKENKVLHRDLKVFCK